MPSSEPPPRLVAGEDWRRVASAQQPSPSAVRNRGPILEVLTRVLPKKGVVLEIGSGTGELWKLISLPRTNSTNVGPNKTTTVVVG